MAQYFDRVKIGGDPTEMLRVFKNKQLSPVIRGLSFSTVPRMNAASAIAWVGVGYLDRTVMAGIQALVALSALTGMIWGLSERDIMTSSLNLQGNGPWEMLAIVASIVVFAQVSISMWAFPTLGAYILSLSFIGSFWATGFMIQPGGN